MNEQRLSVRDRRRAGAVDMRMAADGKNGLIQSFLSHRFSTAEIYFIAVACVLTAFVLRLALHGLLDDRATFTFFIPPILIAAVIGVIPASIF